MKFWPFTKTEKRSTEVDGFTNILLNAVESQADSDDSQLVRGVAAIETAAGLWRRAFSSAAVDPATPLTQALTPEFLGWIGQELVLRGEGLAVIQVEGGKLELLPVGDFSVTGKASRNSWRYRCTVYGPSSTLTYQRAPADQVIHCRWSYQAELPEFGASPWKRASLTSTLLGNLEKRLSEETGGIVGHLLPVPSDPEPAEVDGEEFDAYGELRQTLKTLKGKTALVETTAGGFGEGMNTAPRKDFVPVRIGADPPDSLRELREDVAHSLLQACGVPLSLVSERGDGAARREAWRQFLHSSVSPVARSVEAELSEKLETPVTLSFDRLFASDVMSKARAAASLAGSGVELDEALRLAGLE